MSRRHRAKRRAPVLLEPNRPSPEGAEQGALLADLYDKCETVERLKFPNAQKPCRSCAFLRGTVPNQSLATVMDCFKAVAEQRDFMCHVREKGGKQPICKGWLTVMAATCAHP